MKKLTKYSPELIQAIQTKLTIDGNTIVWKQARRNRLNKPAGSVRSNCSKKTIYIQYHDTNGDYIRTSLSENTVRLILQMETAK